MMTPKLNIAAFFVLAIFNISFVVSIHWDDYTKIPIGNFYRFFDYKPYTTWAYAKERCESDGGMLYYPNNEQEMEAVLRALNVYSRMRMQPSEVSHALHVGYSDPNSDGLLKTVDGRHLTYVWNKWAPGQPFITCYHTTRRRPCSCVEVAVSSHEISINDCFQARAFICNQKPNSNIAVNVYTGEVEPIRPYGYTYLQTAENYYKYYPGLTSLTNWYGAKAKCESDGAELFHPDNLSELEQVINGLRNTPLRNSLVIFLGFSSLDKLGEYKTMDGRFLHDKYQKWSSDFGPDPNNELKRCGALYVPERLLMTYSCRVYTEDFICKRRRPAVVTEAETQSIAACGVDYDYIPSLKSCYKYHKDWEDWFTARAICQSKGGDLFHPDNEQELKLVVAELAIPDDVIISAGFSDLEKRGVYKTVKGRPLEQVFANWGLRPYPNLNTDNYHCGIISIYHRNIYTGLCPLSQRFVCKRAAVSP